MASFQTFWRALVRRRVEDKDDEKNGMARVMGLWDLTALGIGATLGLGFYVLAGEVAHDFAGPAVCLSFLIAAIASGLAGICYAEFASRVPKSGSAYAYSYVTVGEFVAFIIGWNLIFEYVIGTAGVARGFSNYVDTLFGNTMSDYLKAHAAIDWKDFAEFYDFFAFGAIVILTLLLCMGVQETSYLNRICGGINLLTIAIIIVVGASQIDTDNWKLPVNSTTMIVENKTVNVGTGGFMPYGINGVIKGAAVSFFGFVGFDSIASCGEEAKNPKKNIPLSIVIALIVVTIAYLAVAVVLTLMWPYYLIKIESTFPEVFKDVGLAPIGLIVNIGAIFALLTSLIGAFFPLPRILYSMASDGLLFKVFSKTNDKTKAPVFATVVSGIFIGVMALMYNVKGLVELASTGTLLAYSIVAMSVLFLRYQKNNDDDNCDNIDKLSENKEICLTDYFRQIMNIKNLKVPNEISGQIANVAVIAFTIFSLIFAVIRIQIFPNEKNPNEKIVTKSLREILIERIGENYSQTIDMVGYSLLIIFGILMIICMMIMSRQPVAKVDINFKVPLAPLLPCISILINSILMADLNSKTWERFIIWLALGLAIYFFYGIRHSLQGQRDKRNELDTGSENSSD